MNTQQQQTLAKSWEISFLGLQIPEEDQPERIKIKQKPVKRKAARLTTEQRDKINQEILKRLKAGEKPKAIAKKISKLDIAVANNGLALITKSIEGMVSKVAIKHKIRQENMTNKIMALWNEGQNIREIQEKFNKSEHVRRILREQGAIEYRAPGTTKKEPS